MLGSVRRLCLLPEGEDRLHPEALGAHGNLRCRGGLRKCWTEDVASPALLVIRFLRAEPTPLLG